MHFFKANCFLYFRSPNLNVNSTVHKLCIPTTGDLTYEDVFREPANKPQVSVTVLGCCFLQTGEQTTDECCKCLCVFRIILNSSK